MSYHILGNGGFARELEQYLRMDHMSRSAAEFYFHEDDTNSSAVQKAGATQLYFGVGSPKLKKKWYEEAKTKCHNWQLNSFISNNAKCYDWKNQIGDCVIVCPGTHITTNVKIGNCVTINLNCTIGHDSSIGDYSTLAPGVNISGNVHIGKACDIGSNVVIIPGVTLPDNGTIGAGAVVLKTPDLRKVWLGLDNPNPNDNMPEVESYVMVGNPAKLIKINGVKV